MTPRPHPANAPGSFYVGDGCCYGCLAAEGAAPGLMSHHDPDDPGDYHCHLRRQPETTDELDEAIRAACVNCPGGVRYGGDDPAILDRLVRAGFGDRCDALGDGASRPPPVDPTRPMPDLEPDH